MNPYTFQEPSAAWSSPTGKTFHVEQLPELCVVKPGEDSPFTRAIGKIAAYAVSIGMTLGEAEDHMRCAMVIAGLENYPYGRKKEAARALGIHGNTISRIKKRAEKCA